MKHALALLLLLGLGMLGGGLLYQDAGYALFSYNQWAMEMPLWLLMMALLLSFFLFYALLRLITYLWTSPGRYLAWTNRRRSDRLRKQTLQGLIELTEGHWKKAETILTKNVNQELALINNLAAAKAAQELGAYDRRDEHLREAHLSNPKADIAVGLTQAQLQLSHKQYEQALATLMHLRQLAPRHPFVLKLLYRLYVALEDWRHLSELLPQLKKHRVLTQQEVEQLEQDIYRALIAERAGQTEALAELWRRAPKSVHTSPDLIEHYCQKMMALGDQNTPEVLLRDSIKKTWDERLIKLYGVVEGPKPAQQLEIAESWLKGQPNSSVLFLTLGRLSLRNHLWGKARNYFETALSIEPSVAAYRELGMLLDHLGEGNKSAECFKKGLQMATRYLPELPMPTKKEAASAGEEQRLLILGA